MKKAIVIMMIIIMLSLPIVSAQQLAISNVQTYTVDEESVQVTWDTNILSNSKTLYDQGFTKTKSDTNIVTQHNMTIDNLEPDTIYPFKVSSETNEGAIESNELSFKTNPLVTISQIVVTTTTNQAIINFSTNIDINAHIIWSKEQINMNQQSATSTNTKDHSITIDNLEEDTAYYFQVITQYKKSAEGSLKTKIIGENKLEISIPKYSNSRYMDIKGTTGPDSYLLLKVNGGATDKRYTTSGTGSQGIFKFNKVALNSNQQNELLFAVTDSASNKKEYLYNTIVDTKKPTLTITQAPPKAVADEVNVEIKGSVDENVTLIYTISTEKPGSITRVASTPELEEIKGSRITIKWNRTEHPDYKYYNIYRNDILIANGDTNSITDHWAGSGKTYRYQISMVDKNCVEGPKSEALVVQTISGESIEDFPYDTAHKCEVEHQYSPKTILGVFELILPIEEGINYISVKAIDLAGNEDIKSFIVNKDTTPPVITDISPEEATGSGYFIYEGTFGTRVDISGRTEPNATVDLKVEGKIHATVNSDMDGWFYFDDVNIESMFKGASDDYYIPKDPNYETDEPTGEREDEFDVEIELVATDISGLKSESEKLRFTIGTCWSGEMKFSIIPLTKFQMPSMLSPDRIEEGNEQIDFYLQLNYTGDSKDWYVDNIEIKKRCAATRFEKDAKYNLSCKLLTEGSPTIRHSSDKTKWIISYKLNKMDDVSKFTGLSTEDFIKAFRGEIRFPFDVTVRFSENKDEDLKNMKKCMEVSYLLDNSRIDPREVLPEWLLEGSIDFTNKSMKVFDQILPTVKDALKVVAIASFAGFIAKTGARGFRIVTCKTEPFFPDSQCPISGTNGKKRTDYNDYNKDIKQLKIKNYQQDDLTDKELEIACPACNSKWESETKLQTALRWAADRFLCHQTPARWTADKSSTEISTALKKTKQCIGTEEVKRKGIAIIKKAAPDGVSKDILKRNSVYWFFDGAYYILDRTPPVNGKSKLLKVDRAIKDEPQAAKTLTVAFINEQTWMDWDDIPSYYKETKLKDNEVVKAPVNVVQKSQCLGEKGTKYKRIAADSVKKYSYREDRIKLTCYNEYKYFEERDQPACFGQNNPFYKEDMPMLKPQQFTSTFQCLCVSGIYNRLKQLKNIMTGMNNCLNQIKTTGEANGGVCKEVFTRYICDSLWQLITYATKGCAPAEFEKDVSIDGGLDNVKLTISSMFDSLGESAAELNEEYGNSVLTDYLGGGTQGIMRKVCLGSLTGDWGIDFEGIIDSSYPNSFNTYANAWPASREFLGSIPYNDKARYEYRVAWQISPGCNIDSYNVQLACINQDTALENGGNKILTCERALLHGLHGEDHPHRGCDCWELEEEKTEFFAVGNRLTQGQFEDQSHSKIIESSYRYDYVKVKVNIFDKKVKDECLPEGHKDGVWYFPIEDKTKQDLVACSFDPMSKTFRCENTELLWDQGGKAYFIGEPTMPEGADKRKYHPGEKLMFKTQIFNSDQDKPQCLYIELQNSNGHKLPSFQPVLKEIDKNGTHTYDGTILKQIEVGGTGVSIEDDHELFGRLSYLSRNNPGYVEFTLKFFDVNGDHKFDTQDHYTLYNENMIQLSKNNPISSTITARGVKLRVSNLEAHYIAGSLGNQERAKERSIKVRAESIKAGSSSHDWIVHMELRHKKEGKDSCSQTDESDGLKYSDLPWQKDIHIRIEPKISDINQCDRAEQQSTRGECMCGETTTNNCGTDTSGKYCYAVGKENPATEDKKCHKVPKCSIGGVENKKACSCETKMTSSLKLVDNTDNKYCCRETNNEGTIVLKAQKDGCGTTTTSNAANFLKDKILGTEILTVAEETKIDACFIYGIIEAEGALTIKDGKVTGTKTSPTGYKGVMQSYKDDKITATDYKAQIKHGTDKINSFYTILKANIKNFEKMSNKWAYVFASYNGGPGVIYPAINRLINYGINDPNFNQMIQAMKVSDFQQYSDYDVNTITDSKYYLRYLDERWVGYDSYIKYKIKNEIPTHYNKGNNAYQACLNG